VLDRSVGVFVWEADCSKITRMEACNEAKEAAGPNTNDCTFDAAERARIDEAPVGLADIAALAKKASVFALPPPSIALVLGLLGSWVVSGFACRGT
jgi:hypothetical protein